jgi:hypothetical protein
MEVGLNAAPVMVGTETARCEIAATQTIQAVLQLDEVVHDVRGMPVDQAVAQLFDVLPLEREPLIKVFPGWWPYLPLTTLRITVN